MVHRDNEFEVVQCVHTGVEVFTGRRNEEVKQGVQIAQYVDLTSFYKALIIHIFCSIKSSNISA